LVERVSASSNGAAARLVPVAVLVVPGFYAVRFLRQLTPTPRQRLLWLLIEERALSIATVLEVVSVISILAAAVGAASLRPSVAVLAALAALAARLLLSLARERAARSASGQPAEHAIRASLIWVIAGLLGLLAVALLVAAVTRGRPGTAVGALVCVVASGALAQLAIRRRASG
jgi:hypothetical protein